MTGPMLPNDERGGAIRSSRMPRPMSVLVMSADAARRADWAKFFEAQGMRTIRCAGPVATSCALEMGRRCPLHDAGDLIFYDEMSVTRRLEGQLDLILHSPHNIAYAASMPSSAGEYPVTEHACAWPIVPRALRPRGEP